MKKEKEISRNWNCVYPACFFFFMQVLYLNYCNFIHIMTKMEMPLSSSFRFNLFSCLLRILIVEYHFAVFRFHLFRFRFSKTIFIAEYQIAVFQVQIQFSIVTVYIKWHSIVILPASPTYCQKIQICFIMFILSMLDQSIWLLFQYPWSSSSST